MIAGETFSRYSARELSATFCILHSIYLYFVLCFRSKLVGGERREQSATLKQWIPISATFFTANRDLQTGFFLILERWLDYMQWGRQHFSLWAADRSQLDLGFIYCYPESAFSTRHVFASNAAPRGSDVSGTKNNALNRCKNIFLLCIFSRHLC